MPKTVTQTAEALPGGWLATSREVVEALEDMTILIERLTPEALWSELDRARALLARVPEGMR